MNDQVEKPYTKPTLALTTENSELFYLPDRQFGLPKLKVKANFFVPGSKLLATPEDYLSLSLFNMGLKEHLREFNYMAQMAKISMSLVPTKKGFKLRASGFNDKFAVFFVELSRRIAEFCHAEEPVLTAVKANFELLKLKRREDLENQLKQPPYTQYGMVLSETVTTGSFSHDKLLSALKNLSFDQYLLVHRSALRSLFVESLVGGNLTEADAIAIQRSLLDTLRANDLCNLLDLGAIRENRLVALVPGQLAVLNSPLQNEADANNVLGLEFQLAQGSGPREINMLLEDYLSSLFFEELRTQQQVGYVVFAVKSFRSQTPGFIFLLQSSKYLPSELAEKTFAFLTEQREAIKNLSEKKFSEIREGKLAETRQEFNSLTEQADYFFTEIDNHGYDFDKKQNRLSALEKLTREDLLAHFEKMFFGEQRVLEVHMSSSANCDRNRAHLASRILPEGSGFEGLSVKMFDSGMQLQREHMLYRDTSLKTDFYGKN